MACAPLYGVRTFNVLELAIYVVGDSFGIFVQYPTPKIKIDGPIRTFSLHVIEIKQLNFATRFYMLFYIKGLGWFAHFGHCMHWFRPIFEFSGAKIFGSNPISDHCSDQYLVLYPRYPHQSL